MGALAQCFEQIGGVPSTALTDRMGCLKGGTVAGLVIPTPAYVRFAAHYGFPPRLLTDMSLRRFGISACTANPKDLPPSLAQHGSCWRSSTSSPLPFQDAPRPHVPLEDSE